MSEHSRLNCPTTFLDDMKITLSINRVTQVDSTNDDDEENFGCQIRLNLEIWPGMPMNPWDVRDSRSNVT